MSHSLIRTLCFIGVWQELFCQTYPVLPVTLSTQVDAYAYQLQMSVGNEITVLNNGDTAVFNAPDNNTLVKVAMTFYYDSTTFTYCGSCIRQIMFGVDGVQHDCMSFNPYSYNPTATLSVQYMSDGSPKSINKKQILALGCAELVNSNVNDGDQIGYIRAITTNPTQDPTPAPTTTPSRSPTVITMQPTKPSYSPIAQPTSCQDDILMNNNSINYVQLLRNFKMANNTMYYINSDHVRCDVSNNDICYVECTEYESCKHSVIIIENKNLSTLVIDCTAASSCSKVDVDIADSIINTIDIYCSDILSCSEMTFRMHTFDSAEISIYCDHEYSCNKLWVNLVNGFLTANIFCLRDYSCDNLVVIGNKQANNINMNVLMHKFSENVFIKYAYFSKINIQCLSIDDEKYIKYNTEKLLYETEMIELSRLQYTRNKLPCESVQVECNEGNSCDFKYNADSFNLTTLLKQKSFIDCQLLNIANILQATCEGSCIEQADMDSFINYNHSVVFDIDILFRIENNSNINLHELCLQYFDTKNSTMSSLQSINIIFEYVLSNLIKYNKMYPDYAIIIELTKRSNTVLRDGMDSLNCDLINNPLRLRSRLEVSSIANSTQDIDVLFGDNSLFVLNSRKAIEEYFVLPIDSIVIHTIIIDDTNEKIVNKLAALLWFVAIICFIAFCVCILITCKWKHQQIQRNEMTIYISNPMVICIAIGQYDSHPIDSDFSDELKFTNLDGVGNDIINMIYIYKILLGYTIYPYYNIVNAECIKEHWRKEEIIEFLSNKASELELGIDEYDGLVVVISSHGFKNSVVCSDYKLINKTDIHRLFSVDHPSLRHIPRLFVYDCCDGQQGKRDDYRFEIQGKSIKKLKRSNKTKISFVNDDSGKGIKKSKRNRTKVVGFREQSKSVGINNKTLKRTVSKYRLKTQNSIMWTKEEVNPDFRLAIINGANPNFQSFMNPKIGSYCIYKLSKKMCENIMNNNNEKFLSEIFDQVQNELKDKQLMIATWNNGTGKIKFQKHEKENINLPQTTLNTITSKHSYKDSQFGESPNHNDDIQTDIQLQNWIHDILVSVDDNDPQIEMD